MANQKRKQYTGKFKKEAIESITSHGYSVAEAAG